MEALFELPPHNFEKILPLYLSEEKIFPLILAVVRQKQRGWVFVNDSIQPASALVINNFGFMQFIGIKDIDDRLINFFGSPKASMPSYLLCYSPPPQIQKMLDDFPEQQVRRRERVRFAFNQPINRDKAKYPSGYEVQLLTEELIRITTHFQLDLGTRFWASTTDFLEHGIGIGVVKDGAVVSLCYSACVVDKLAEIDIVTQGQHRGLGLAKIAAQAFINECIRRGITPTWDCFTSNTASMQLARQLGFEETYAYFLYSFNLPINLLTKVPEVSQ
ncbi:MAG: GNAT family N-acetyltransferase [Chloroflexota bacterium]